ncbi:MIR domain protein [Ichthyophthirius multifiliis]|uniref:MIR domain protein n=1 Tax=Ichthyophthirius multifiliis TaxID=5932 RepID=G0QWW8_ICHMU|nr:MIR domain protein [Ichthyophthirius multifiliis]EGR30289.1 MIR domain protein [Ichthyophthirius multifiliis]|eukprot:XP_004031876.1 MIR domain protein [Ichthyophthirius multifiliis]
MIFCSMFILIFFLIKKGPLYYKEAWYQNKHIIINNTNIFTKITKYFFLIILSLIKVFLNLDIIYYIAYGFFSVLGTLQHPFFFCFHLSEFLFRYPTLRNILKSVYEPYVSLVLTFILILLFIYIFTIFGYVLLNQKYQNRCEELYICFFETFDQNFKNNGGLGGFFQNNIVQSAQNYNFFDFFFENMGNIIINIILVQIFAGIIIDKFSQLRGQENEKMIDIQEVCFICGNQRELFNRKSDQGFIQHIKNEHYLWNYIYYLAYLEDKEVTEYSGIESYVYFKLQNKDFTWFPIQRAAVLVDEEQQIQQELQKYKDLQNEVFYFILFFQFLIIGRFYQTKFIINILINQ